MMLPAVELIAENRVGLAVRKVDINRRNIEVIDFNSPLAEQWAINSVPTFVIVNEKGGVVARGQDAKDMVRNWYGQAQMAQSAGQNPEISKPYKRPAPMGEEP